MRKGIVASLGPIIIAVVGGGVIASGVLTLSNGPIKDKVDIFSDRLDEVGAGEPVKIGSTGGSGDAKKEIKALAAVNMMKASNCGINSEIRKRIDRRSTKESSLEDVRTTTDSWAFLPADAIETLETNTGYEPCYESLGIGSNPLDLNILTGDYHDEVDQDLEGIYSRGFFNINTNFVISRPKIFGFDVVKSSSDESPDDCNDKCPDLWDGKRASFFIPSGLKARNNVWANAVIYPDPPDEKELKTGRLFSPREKMNAFRVRMQNVPTVIDEGSKFRENINTDAKLKAFVKNVKYQMCEGAEGYIQSNAYHIDNSEDVKKDEPKRENTVYPFIKMTERGLESENGVDCLKRGGSEMSIGNWFGVGTPETNVRYAGTCSLGEAKNVMANPQGNPNNVNGIREVTVDGSAMIFKCGLRKKDFSFDDYGSVDDGWEAGWFAECRNPPYKVNISSDYDVSEGDSSQFSVNPAKLSYDKYQDSNKPEAKWRLSEFQDEKRMEAVMQYIRGSSNGEPGKVKFYRKTLQKRHEEIARINFQNTQDNKVKTIKYKVYDTNIQKETNILLADPEFNLLLNNQGNEGEIKVKIWNGNQAISKNTTIQNLDSTQSVYMELTDNNGGSNELKIDEFLIKGLGHSRCN